MRKAIAALAVVVIGAVSFAATVERRLIGAEDMNRGAGTFTDSIGTVLNKVRQEVIPFDNTYTLTGAFRDVVSKGPALDIRAFGAIPDNNSASVMAANTVAFQAAHDNLTSGIGTILVPGTFYMSGQVNLTGTETHIVGVGGKAIIYFNPTADNLVLFNFDRGTLAYNHSVENLILFTNDATRPKTFIRMKDVRFPRLSNLYMVVTGSKSVCLDLRGRDTGTVNHIFAQGPKPIVINPDTYVNANTGLDHWHFSDLYLTGTDNTEYLVTVAPNIQTSACTWDGYQAWVGGKGGYWADNTWTSNSNTFRNIRYEGGLDSSGYIFYVTPMTDKTHNNMVFDRVWASGLTARYMYLRGVNAATINDGRYDATSGYESLNIDNTVNGLSIINSMIKGVPSTSGATLTWSVADNNAAAIPRAGYYKPDSDTDQNFRVNSIVVATDDTPASPTAACTKGQITYDNNYVYWCYSDNNWRRAAYDNTW